MRRGSEDYWSGVQFWSSGKGLPEERTTSFDLVGERAGCRFHLYAERGLNQVGALCQAWVRDSLMSTVLELELRRLRVDEYHRMIDAGILGDGDEVELLEGVIVSVSPQNRKHAFAIQRLAAMLDRVVDEGRYAILPQLPMTLGDRNEPEPDLAVVPAEEAASSKEHPSRAVRIVEVSGDSLAKYRGVKASIYARFGIPEYWIVNLLDECIEVHRDLDTQGEGYRSVVSLGRGQEAACAGVPEIRVAVDRLFRWLRSPPIREAGCSTTESRIALSSLGT